MHDSAHIDNLDVYSQKMLADGAELSVVRFMRNNHLEALDRDRLRKLVSLFEDALAADKAISGAQMASSTDHSVSVLSMMTGTLARLTIADAVRSAIEYLKGIAEQVVEGSSPTDVELKKLMSFLRQYSLIQEERLKGTGSARGSNGGIWPDLPRTMSF